MSLFFRNGFSNVRGLLYQGDDKVSVGKSRLVFPKLTKVTIHMNSTLSENTRQNTDTK